MKVCPSLKLNKYEAVSIPRNRDLYARVGGRIPSIGTSGFTAEIGKNKLDIVADSESDLLAEMEKSST